MLVNLLPDRICPISNITTKQEPQPIETPDSRIEAQRARGKQQKKTTRQGGCEHTIEKREVKIMPLNKQSCGP